MSAKKKNKKQKVVMSKNLIQFVIVKEQKSKRNIWILLGYLLGLLVEPIIGEIVIRLPIIEALIKLLSF